MDGIVLTLRQFSSALDAKAWPLAAALAVVAIVAGLRFAAGRIPLLRWLCSDRGGATLAIIGGIAARCAAGIGSGSNWSWSWVIDGVLLGLASIGVYSAPKKLLSPSDKFTPWLFIFLISASIAGCRNAELPTSIARFVDCVAPEIVNSVPGVLDVTESALHAPDVEWSQQLDSISSRHGEAVIACAIQTLIESWANGEWSYAGGGPVNAGTATQRGRAWLGRHQISPLMGGTP
jgi:hypothetical protein